MKIHKARPEFKRFFAGVTLALHFPVAKLTTSMGELQNALDHPLPTHFLTVGGVILAFFAISRLLINKHQPSNTLAWLVVIVLVPYLGAPLYFFFGGRKMRRLVARKSNVAPTYEAIGPVDLACQIHPTVQALTASGFPPVGGNLVAFISDGQQAYAELEREIRAATASIEITTFILARDDTGKRLVQLLAERARAGIKVRLLLDALGCFFSSSAFVQPLRDAGGEVATFMPVLPLAFKRSANLRNHRKIALFDRRIALVGGHNLAKEYLGPDPFAKRWQDFGARLEGPAATLLHEVFLADWAFATSRPLSDLRKRLPAPAEPVPGGTAVLQVVASGPDVSGDPLYEGILSMIQEARESIWIVTPYFIPDEVLWRSLMVKARAGTEVTIILPARSNHRVTDFARRHYLRELRRAGARVRLFRPGMLHSKAVMIDERIGLFGSANFDLRSLFVNFEIGLFVYSRPECLAMRRWAESLLERTEPPPQERPRRERLLGALAEDFARLLAPLL